MSEKQLAVWYRIDALSDHLAGVSLKLSGAGRLYSGWFALDYYGRKRFHVRGALGVVKIKKRHEPNLWHPLCERGRHAARGLEPIVLSKEQVPEVRRVPAAARPDDASDCDDLWPQEYSAAPNIARDEVEHRLLRALRWADESVVPASMVPGIMWPVDEISAEWTDYADEITRAPERQSPRDISDWLNAMSWLTRLARGMDGDILNGLYWRAINPPCSWSQIGRRLNIDRRAVKRDYERAIDRVWRFANE